MSEHPITIRVYVQDAGVVARLNAIANALAEIESKSNVLTSTLKSSSGSISGLSNALTKPFRISNKGFLELKEIGLSSIRELQDELNKTPFEKAKRKMENFFETPTFQADIFKSIIEDLKKAGASERLIGKFERLYPAIEKLEPSIRKTGLSLQDLEKYFGQTLASLGLNEKGLATFEKKLGEYGTSLESVVLSNDNWQTSLRNARLNIETLNTVSKTYGISQKELLRLFPEISKNFGNVITQQSLYSGILKKTLNYENLDIVSKKSIEKIWASMGKSIGEGIAIAQKSANTFESLVPPVVEVGRFVEDTGNRVKIFGNTLKESLSGASFVALKRLGIEDLVKFDQVMTQLSSQNNNVAKQYDILGRKTIVTGRDWEMLANVIKESGMSTEDVINTIEDAKTAYRGINSEFGNNEASISDLVKKYSLMRNQINQVVGDYGTFDNQLRQLGTSLDDLILRSKDWYNASRRAVGNFTSIRAFSEMSRISLQDLGLLMPELANSIDKPVRKFGFYNAIVAKTLNYNALTEAQQKALSRVWNALGIDIENARKAVYASTMGLEEFVRSSNEWRGSLGLLGNTAQKFGKQFLWIGLGSMFLIMSLSKVIASSDQARASALSLLKAEYSLYLNRKKLRDILIEYGRSSDEGREAIRQFKIQQMETAQSSLNLQNQLKMEGLAMTQFVLSAVGQFVSMGTMMSESFGPLTTNVSTLIANLDRLFASLSEIAMQEGLTAQSADSLANAHSRLSTAISGTAGTTSVANAEISGSNAVLGSTAITSKIAGDTIVGTNERIASSAQLASNLTLTNAESQMIDSQAKMANAISGNILSKSFKEEFTSSFLAAFGLKRLEMQSWRTAIAQMTATLAGRVLAGTLMMIGTMGIGLAIGMAWTAIQTKQMTEELEKMRKQVNLNIKGSGYVDLNKEISKFNSLLSDVTPKVKETSLNLDAMHGITKETKLVPNLSSSVSNVVTIGPININANGEDSAVEIANEVKREILRGIENVGIKFA